MGQFSFLRLENSKELLMSACKNNEVDTLVQNNRLELGELSSDGDLIVSLVSQMNAKEILQPQ